MLAEAVAEARELEKERYEAVVVSLRAQVDACETSLRDSQTRSEGCLAELLEARAEHEGRTAAARAQIEQLQGDVDRTHAQNLSLMDSLATEEKGARLVALDLAEAKRSLNEALGQAGKWRAELATTTEERNALLKQRARLQAEVDALKLARKSDFNSVAGSVLQVMGRELDSLRVTMGIPSDLHE